ncbi:MAG: ComE operon protein 3 [Candidatus Dichloromethanomonas elyunquensis]|nr:MAG: ComE operon protein 3 [Candidatus Dichloromethanomonas elyunquensis]
MKDPLLRRAAAVVCGGFIAVQPKQEVRIWILAFLVLLFIRLWFLWKPSDFWGKMYKPEISFLAAGILIGFIYGMTAERIIAPPLLIQEIELEGKLEQWKMDQAEAEGVILLENTPQYAEGLGQKYAIYVFADSKGQFHQGWDIVEQGDRIRFAGRLEQPQEPGTEGQFNLPLYNAVRGLSGSITAKGNAILLNKGVPGIPWKIREKVNHMIKINWPEQSGIMDGILFGDSSRIPAETLNMYKAAGVMHILAASGSNIAFVIALIWGIFFFLPRKVRIIWTIGAVVLYTALCQYNPPILRAAILGIAVLTGRMGKGKMSSLRWLMFAGLMMFISKPLYLKDISFQLSFAATWGMIVLTPRLEKNLWLQKFPGPLRTLAAVFLSTQIAALPILINAFHTISLAGFLTNIVALFILGAVLQFGLLGTALVLFPSLSKIFFQTGFWLLRFSDSILHWAASLPFAYFWVLNPGKIFWMAWYAALGIWLAGREKVWFIFRVQCRRLPRPFKNRMQDKNLLFCVKCLFLAVFIFLLNFPWLQSDMLTITFLDVGQGDCMLIQTAEENLIVDTGPRKENYDAGERVLVPYLMEKQIKQLDMVFITHEDHDHCGGAKYLLANIPVKALGVPEVGDRLENPEWQEAIPLEFLHKRDQLVRLLAGDTLAFSSGLKIEVLAPVSTIGGTASDANNNSLVLLLDYLGSRILLTGDMEKEEMQQISDRGVKWSANFIKIPHHGAKGALDTSWFDETDPQAVFISVGKNSFGHPSPEVLAYWQERNIKIFRTDIQGTIELKINHEGFQIIPGRYRDEREFE